MKIAFRADASIEQGTGHLMRCFHLANRLSSLGHQCVFITQPFLPDFIRKIVASKLNVITMSKNGIQSNQSSEYDQYLEWLGRTVMQDAAETKSIIDGLNIDILVADHYAIDSSWMDLFSDTVDKRVIIDDLANRKHSCDLLIDQNYGRTHEQYFNLVTSATKLLLGTNYVLINEDFQKARRHSKALRLNRKQSTINICMGGIDKDNATLKALAVLDEIYELQNWNVDVVLRSESPHIESIKEYSQKMSITTSVVLDSENIAALFSKADIAIGAGGVTMWERCCLGLPTILVTIADNQIPAASAVSATGACLYAGDIRDLNWTKQLEIQLKLLVGSPSKVHSMSVQASKVCDGWGLNKVCNVIEGL